MRKILPVAASIAVLLAAGSETIRRFVLSAPPSEQQVDQKLTAVDDVESQRASNAWLRNASPEQAKQESVMSPSTTQGQKNPALLPGRGPSEGEQTVQAVDESVIGRPFPLSESVRRTCEKMAIFCKKGEALLAALAEEPRDERWAATTEDMIRREITRKEFSPQTIRGLECRRTICAVEATTQTAMIRFGDEINFGHVRSDGSFLFGQETHAPGDRVLVFVRFFYRR
jgi:hypothetical protein